MHNVKHEICIFAGEKSYSIETAFKSRMNEAKCCESSSRALTIHRVVSGDRRRVRFAFFQGSGSVVVVVPCLSGIDKKGSKSLWKEEKWQREGQTALKFNRDGKFVSCSLTAIGAS